MVKLDKIDEDVRGNKKVGINVRLDRLEKLKYLEVLGNREHWQLVY